MHGLCTLFLPIQKERRYPLGMSYSCSYLNKLIIHLFSCVNQKPRSQSLSPNTQIFVTTFYIFSSQGQSVSYPTLLIVSHDTTQSQAPSSLLTTLVSPVHSCFPGLLEKGHNPVNLSNLARCHTSLLWGHSSGWIFFFLNWSCYPLPHGHHMWCCFSWCLLFCSTQHSN